MVVAHVYQLLLQVPLECLQFPSLRKIVILHLDAIEVDVPQLLPDFPDLLLQLIELRIVWVLLLAPTLLEVGIELDSGGLLVDGLLGCRGVDVLGLVQVVLRGLFLVVVLTHDNCREY